MHLTILREKLRLAAMFISIQTWLPAAKANLKTPRFVRKTIGVRVSHLLYIPKLIHSNFLQRKKWLCSNTG
ncbi:Uncharacterized protein APZ42_013922 [Daphnia magna]|uniref:Uncharacterized protein n=1 Tax=Daphnia magna TaxID=35525 RepID=A0A162QDG8_9CRUS|nr:Uncharacterized protein APZ42_013922 [Daphnia magna]